MRYLLQISCVSEELNETIDKHIINSNCFSHDPHHYKPQDLSILLQKKINLVFVKVGIQIVRLALSLDCGISWPFHSQRISSSLVSFYITRTYCYVCPCNTMFFLVPVLWVLLFFFEYTW